MIFIKRIPQQGLNPGRGGRSQYGAEKTSRLSASVSTHLPTWQTCQCSSHCLRRCGVPDVDDPRNVLSDEIAFNAEHLSCSCRRTKMIRSAFGSRIIVACWGPSSPLCPVALTELLSKESRHAGQAPIFGKVIRGEQVCSFYVHPPFTPEHEKPFGKQCCRWGLSATSMSYTVCVLVEHQKWKRQQYWTASSSPERWLGK